jgi:hypothetical protein
MKLWNGPIKHDNLITPSQDNMITKFSYEVMLEQSYWVMKAQHKKLWSELSNMIT